ncbi:MAG: response regulator [Planctomycetota bacterium]
MIPAPHSALGSVPADGSDRASRRIVVCDDEPHITLAVSLKLRQAGFEVETFPDGQAAWESVEANPPAALVTDCQMPRLNGLDLLRRMRAEPSTAQTPAVMLTGKGFELSPDDLERQLGPALLFCKPFSPRDLLATVERLVNCPTG